jgi:hypothetical protein
MKFWKYGQVKAYIKAYQKRGFFQIRFPGGTSWDGKMNSVILVAVFDSLGRLYFVVIPYDPKSSLVNEERNEIETKVGLAIRKLEKEVGLTASPCDLKLILVIVVNDNRSKGHEKHIKYFYLLEKFSGEFVDRENSSFLNTETATPFLIPAPLLAKVIFRGHFLAFKKAIEKLHSRLTRNDAELINLSIIKREELERVIKNKRK